MTSEALRNAISLHALVDGARRLKLQDGEQTGLYGPAVAPASPSAWPVEDSAPRTSATFGQSLDALLRTVTLQSSLESRLQARMAATGSLEYDLTWKRWDMVSGQPICALRALKRKAPFYWLGVTDTGENLLTLDPHISASVCTGWPTVRTVTGGAESAERKQELGRTASGGGDLQSIALIAGWVSPTVQYAHRVVAPPRPHDTGIPLSQQVYGLAGWNTPHCPREHDSDSGSRSTYLDRQIGGWATVCTRDYRSESASPEFDQKRDAHTRGKSLPYQALGAVNSSPAATEKRGVLNPDLCRWLMGYPAGWHLFAVTATQ